MKSHVNTGRSALLEENWLFLLAGSTQAGWVSEYYSDRENGSDKPGTTIAQTTADRKNQRIPFIQCLTYDNNPVNPP